ncbi:MAG: hypothetical protein AAF620_14485 [Bacteroidota bacterium]
MTRENISFNMKITTILFVCVLAIFPKVQASTALPILPNDQGYSEHTSKKEERKTQRWEKKKAKWEAKTKKERKNKFGRLGLLVLLGGVVLLVASEAFLILALIATFILGVIGISRDEKKTAAIISVVVPFVLYLLGSALAIASLLTLN